MKLFYIATLSCILLASCRAPQSQSANLDPIVILDRLVADAARFYCNDAHADPYATQQIAASLGLEIGRSTKADVLLALKARMALHKAFAVEMSERASARDGTVLDLRNSARNGDAVISCVCGFYFRANGALEAILFNGGADTPSPRD